MGQYYHPTSLTQNQYIYARDYSQGLKLMEHSYFSPFMDTIEWLLSSKWYRNKMAWIGDYSNLVDKYHSAHKIKPKIQKAFAHRYLVNHTKKFCIDLNLEKTIHPLPLLVSSGNGRGGGDYRGSDMQLVGSWCGDEISIERNEMYSLNPSINFEEGLGLTRGNYQFRVSEKVIEEEQAKLRMEAEKREMDRIAEEEFKKSEAYKLLI